MYDKLDNRDDYVTQGPAHAEAWLILEQRCDVPPSLEVFLHEISMIGGSPVATARAIAANYSRRAGLS